MPFFEFDGQRIAYTEFGGGPAALTPAASAARTARSAPANARPLILLHGLLLSQEMHRPLAKALAARGNRVITLDLLGHGALGSPARHVALLDGHVRRAGGGAHGPPGARARRS